MTMRADLDHLPGVKRRELERVARVLFDEFEDAVKTKLSDKRKGGRILKLILFGSYARDDWVDEPENGYQSDYDLLIVVSHADLTDVADYWHVAEDRILRDSAIARPVNIIVHSLDEVNQALTRGEYFWVDIARDGIAIYDLPCHSLATPMPLTAADAYRMAQGYFDQWFESAERYLATGISHTEKGWHKEAAFELHQATERLYICFLLVQTLYFPRSHNIKFLRSLAEDKDPRLVDAWPRETRLDRRRFELLKRAYVEARYSASYAITTDDLEALAAAIGRLREIVAKLCNERLTELKADAAA